MTASLSSLSSRPPQADRPPRRIPAWVIPLGILSGFCVLFALLFGDRLLPAPKVEVGAVLATISDQKSEAPGTSPAAAAGNPLFQASGWIEPSPFPIKSTALIDGVVDTVAVLPGQTVKKGDVLATLIGDDARLALATAEQNGRTLVSTAEAHQAAINGAGKKLVGLKAQVAAAGALRDEAADRMARFDGLPAGAVSKSDVVSAKLRRDREESQYLTAVAAVDEMEAEIARLEAEARIRQDDIRAAGLEVEKARLAMSRTKILSPVDGRILRLHAAPGQKKMLQDQDPESSTIAVLYRPGELQARVDVPLADAAGLRVGQEVRMRCGLLPEKVFHGKVILISGEADVQRNTLQAKVSVEDAVDELRPEMLCRVEFMAAAGGAGAASAQVAGALSTWVPESAVADGAAWVCDPESKRVAKRPVSASGEKRDGFLRISDGLRPGEWVVLSPTSLRENQRVTPTLIEK